MIVRRELEMLGEEEAALEEIVRSRGFAEHQILPNIFFDAPRRTIMFMYSGEYSVLKNHRNRTD